MIDERNDELSPEERSSLASLPSSLDPPEHLEQRIATELRTRGLVRSRGTSYWRPIAAAASIAIAFAAGWGARAWTTPTAAGESSTQPRYMLLLYGAESAPGEEPQRVSEYRDWAVALVRGGIRVSGEKLDDRMVSFGSEISPSAVSQRLGGYFIIDAGDDRAAEALARSHPHLKHGGQLVVRRIADH